MGSSFDWKTQVVVITGASAGIGAALAREIGRRGGSYMRPEALQRVLDYYRGLAGA